MSQLNYTTKNRKGKHLNYKERIKIEALSKSGIKSEAIAKQIGCSGRTVRRELAKGTSISERPKNVDKRRKYGDWEMDTVVGGKGTKEVLLVLTERKTREQIIRKIKSKSQYCVVKELDKIE